MTSEAQADSCRVCAAKLAVLWGLPEAPRTVQTLLRAQSLASDHPLPLIVCRCANCGLVQLAGDPDLEHVYSPDYLCSVNFSAHALAYQQALARRWADDHGLKRRQVLEIGGGDGLFASLLRDQGCELTLIDPAARACQIARERGIPRVLEGYLTADTLPGTTFDAVVARHVLEHVSRPRDFLALVRQYLEPGGMFFLEMPNLDGIVRHQRFQDFYAEHLSYFDPRSLTYLLTAAGFEVLELYTIEAGDYLVCVARLPRVRLETMLADLEQFRERFTALANESRAAGRRLAVWGAGGRCVALFALVRAHELGIAYVVDSDKNKWGRFTPVTHLPVMGPERLQSDPVDDLLIVSTAYQDEILRDNRAFARNGRRLGVLLPEPRWLSAAEIPEASVAS